MAHGKRSAGLVALVLLGAALQVVRAPEATAVAAPSCPDEQATEAQAAAVARACAKRVEVLSARTETSQTYAKPTGSFVYEATAVPKRVHRPDGSWVGADATLTRTADGSYTPLAALSDLVVSGGGTGPFVTARRGSASMSLSWPTSLPVPVVTGSTATYSDVMPGVDLQVIARVDGFSHNVIVKSAAAAANPALRRLDLATATSGVSLAAAPDGSGAMAALDRDGHAVFQSAPPHMWSAFAPGPRSESAERPVRGVGVEVGKSTLALVPDPELLAGANWPVTIDPSWITWTGGPSTGMSWAQVYKAFPNAPHFNDTDPEGLRVGHAQADATTNWIPYTNRSFWLFNIPSNLQYAVIDSATFTAYERYAWTCTKMWVDLWTTGDVYSGTTWNAQPSWYRQIDSILTGYGYNSSCPAQTVGWNVKSAVMDAASLNWSTLTLGLKIQNENQESPSNWHKYVANSARLTVGYDRYPVPPSNLGIDVGGQTYPCASGAAAPHVNTSAGVNLKATLSDPDGGSLTARWVVNGTALADGPPGQSGDTQVRSIPASSFPTDGATYSWQVSAYDGVLAGSASPVCELVADLSVPAAGTATSTDLNLALDPAPLGTTPATAVVGRTALVTLHPAPNTTDIVGYRYRVSTSNSNPPLSWVSAAPDGTAVIPVVPIAFNLTKNFLVFNAIDNAGNVSPSIRYAFKALAGTTTHVLADATGDGRSDVTALAPLGTGNSLLWRWDATTTGMSAPTAVQDPGSVYPTGSTLTAEGDVDGDGLSDIAVFTQAGADVVVTVQRSDRNHLLGSQTLLTLSGYALSQMKVLAADFTGDGKADVAIKYNLGSASTKDIILASTSTVGNLSLAAPAVWALNCQGCDDWNRSKIVAGDFNFDGKADIAEFYDYGGGITKIWMYNSTGTAFVSGGMVWDSGAGFWNWSVSKFFVGDFNGDGRMDVGATYGDPYSYATSIWFFLQQPSGVLGAPVAWTAYAQQWNLDFSATDPVGADVNGDGRSDVALIVRCCGANQVRLWTILSTGSGLAAPTSPWAGALGLVGAGTVSPVPGTRYQLVAAHSGKCVEVAGASTANGAALDQVTCSSGALNQQFTLNAASGAYLQIRPAHVSGKCVTVSGSSTANGAAIVQSDCAAFTPSQLFMLTYQSGTGTAATTWLQGLQSLRCIAVAGAGTTDGTPLVQWDCFNALNWSFSLRPL